MYDEELLKWLAEMQRQNPERPNPQPEEVRPGVMFSDNRQSYDPAYRAQLPPTPYERAQMEDNPVDPRSGLFKFPVGGLAEQQARQAAAGVMPVPGATGGQNLNQLRAIAESLKGMDPKFSAALLGKLTGIDPEAQRDEAMLRRQMAIAQFQHSLGAGERQEARDDRRTVNEGAAEDRKIQREGQRQTLAETTRRTNVDDDRNAFVLFEKMKKAGVSEEALKAFADTVGLPIVAGAKGWFVDDKPTLGSRAKPTNLGAITVQPNSDWRSVATELAKRAGKDPTKMSIEEKRNFKTAAETIMQGGQPQPQRNIFEPVKPPEAPKPQQNPVEQEMLKLEQEAAKFKKHTQEKKIGDSKDKERQQAMDKIQKRMEEMAAIKYEEDLLRLRRQRYQHP